MMIPAELQRLILMIAMAATGYLLILAWNNDYGDAAKNVSVTSAPDAGVAPSLGVTESVTPGLPALDGGVGSGTQVTDVPSSDLVAPISGSAVAAPVATPDSGDSAAAGSRLVKVFTDNLELWIDLRGGDIVRARLPQYPVSLDEGAESFVLLDRSGGRTYIAQSGLIGPTGLDSGGERPLFASSANNYDFRGKDGTVTLEATHKGVQVKNCLLYTSPSPRDATLSRMPSSA